MVIILRMAIFADLFTVHVRWCIGNSTCIVTCRVAESVCEVACDQNVLLRCNAQASEQTSMTDVKDAPDANDAQ